MLAGMKPSALLRATLLLGWLAVLSGLCAARTWAQNPAAEAAARQAEEERYLRLNAAIEDLQASFAALQRRVAALRDELQAAREEQAAAARTYVTRAELQDVIERLRELDRKREEDRKLILDEIRKLAQVPLPEPPKRAAPPEPMPPPAAKGYKYLIKQGDTLDAIIAAYRNNGVKVGLDQVLQANPGIKPTALQIGQEVFIPDPALK
ncbi:MAG: LysM peptidoglycan-binding domain-containing protein [Verrucomicrobia bacterium]|nr:LysM peptidoglycan-binding domain-containing protein [Verrucomicrobiota bacterium]